MTDIAKMAREAGLWRNQAFGGPIFSGGADALERFASLVRAAALAEAANVCEAEIRDRYLSHDLDVQAYNLAEAIRALAQQDKQGTMPADRRPAAGD